MSDTLDALNFVVAQIYVSQVWIEDR